MTMARESYVGITGQLVTEQQQIVSEIAALVTRARRVGLPFTANFLESVKDNAELEASAFVHDTVA